MALAIATSLLATSCTLLPGAGSSHGNLRVTDRDLDLAIDGEGYFIVQTTAGGFLFTRNGELAVSSGGELVNNDGYTLYPPIKVSDSSSGIRISSDGSVHEQHAGEPATAVGQIILSRFENTSDLERDGQYVMPAPDAANPVTGRPGSKGLGMLVIGRLEMIPK